MFSVNSVASFCFLESYPKTHKLWIEWDFCYFYISDIIVESFPDITDAVINIIYRPLRYHLNRSAGYIADLAGQPVPVGQPMNRKTKTDPLDSA